jgi:hypothetical protein
LPEITGTQATEGCALGTGDRRIRQAIMRMYGCSRPSVQRIAAETLSFANHVD